MKRRFAFWSIVLNLLLSMSIVGCSEVDPTEIHETVEAGVGATMTAESAIEAAVETSVAATLIAGVTIVPSATYTVMPPTPTLPPPDTPTLTPTMPPTPTLPPPDTPTLTPAMTPTSILPLSDTPTLTPATQSGLAILDPVEGAEVPRIIQVSGSGAQATLQSGTYLNIIVTTRTGEHWVQTTPLIESNGNWTSSPVYIGTVDIGVGETFRICAVLTDQQLDVGRILEYPAGPATCVNVVRS